MHIAKNIANNAYAKIISMVAPFNELYTHKINYLICEPISKEKDYNVR